MAIRQKDFITNQNKLSDLSRIIDLGMMGAKIAHEINNPLTIIKLHNKSISKISKDEKVVSYTKKIDHSIERIVAIIKGIKNISRKGENDPKEKVCLKNTIDEVLSICSNKLNASGVEIITKDISRDHFIFARTSQIAQILLNLISNAHDTVKDQDTPWIKITAEEHASELVINIIDSGNGIPIKLHEKIQKEFYTTKPEGVGTGLGLNIIKETVKELNGRIEIGTIKGHTCFSIHLPKYNEEIAS